MAIHSPRRVIVAHTRVTRVVATRLALHMRESCFVAAAKGFPRYFRGSSRPIFPFGLTFPLRHCGPDPQSHPFPSLRFLSVIAGSTRHDVAQRDEPSDLHLWKQ